MEKLTEQEIIRRQKMEELKAMGIDPFGHAYERTHKSGQIREEFGELTKEELEEKNVTVKIAGRIMTKRRRGKLDLCTFKIWMGKFRFMYVKMYLVMMRMKYSKNQI